MDNKQHQDDHIIDAVVDQAELVGSDDIKHEQAKPHSVTGEEDPFSEDATNSESQNIDAELEKVGLHGDTDDSAPTPLGVGNELDEETT